MPIHLGTQGQESIPGLVIVGQNCAGSSSMEVTTMVSDSAIDADRLPIRPSSDAQNLVVGALVW